MNRYGYSTLPKYNYPHKKKHEFFLKALQKFSAANKELTLKSIDVENQIFTFHSYSLSRHTTIGVFVDCTKYYVKEYMSVEGNYDDTQPLINYIQILREISDKIKNSFKSRSIYLVTNLNFEFFSPEHLKTLPLDVHFYNINKNNPYKVEAIKKIVPNSQEFFKLSINKLKELKEQERRFKNSMQNYKSFSNDVDEESAIMNMLRNGEGDTIGF